MKKEKDNNGFLGFMNALYYVMIVIVIIGTVIVLKEIPKQDPPILIVLVPFVSLIQILIIYNLIVLNKGNMGHSTDGEKENSNITEGLFEEFYDNGNIKIRGNYVNGKKDGVWEFFYSDGALNVSQTFKNGQEIS